MVRTLSILLFTSTVLASACRRDGAALPLAPSFYCWQTSLSLSPEQHQYLQQSGVKTLHLKVLDVGLDPASGAIIPYARLRFTDTSYFRQYALIPVVFITNEVFQQITAQQIQELAMQVAASQPLLSNLGLPAQTPEFQVDCDWTNSTRAAFFEFLTALRSRLAVNTVLSATIRLHQYKFPHQTGVPPVDRGMLMCYNTGDIDAVAEQNSIFSVENARKYIIGAPENYLLPLDLALPVFSWTLVYRDEELWRILPEARHDLPSGVLEKGTFRSGHYLRPGDQLRKEEITPELLLQATQLVARADLAKDARLAFFQLDTSTPREYPVSLIQHVCRLADSIRINR